MVARLTPDQKVACSIHVGFKTLSGSNFYYITSHHAARDACPHTISSTTSTLGACMGPSTLSLSL
ncbi:unnamed protein product [Spirodela intermedia]|uniref:Uncharacterized protein n=1 Tax=Spirodela intermedia TaxID=51605 RepID=A0A7I8IN58_SPIIN|nr:unnamed protein product [Spirodela intermedia]CAA6659395.1 unnamed protein product [Spirodela intermedia]